MGLQGVTGVTIGYRGLQGVTRDCRGVQSITETFFVATTSLDTLSSPILHENQS